MDLTNSSGRSRAVDTVTPSPVPDRGPDNDPGLAELADARAPARQADSRHKTENSHAASTTRSDIKTALEVLSYAGLPGHEVYAMRLGKDLPAVVIERGAKVPIINLDRLSAGKGSQDEGLALGTQLARAFTLCDLQRHGEVTRAGGHPLLENNKRLPDPLYRLAENAPYFSDLAARYMASMANRNGSDGFFRGLVRHSVALVSSVSSSFSEKIPELDIPSFSPPRGGSPVIGAEYLSAYRKSFFSGCYPEEVIGLSFQNSLTKALTRAIDEVCAEKGLPKYKGDPWNVLAASNNYDRSELHQEVDKRFRISGYSVPDWVNESQSKFFRNVGIFWSQFDDHVEEMVRRATNRGDSQLKITIVGVGMNEEPLSVAMATQRGLEKLGVDARMDFEVTVISRRNPTMDALIGARSAGHTAPIIYPEKHLPGGREFEDFFEEKRGGYAPVPSLSRHLNHMVADLTNEQTAARIGASDLVMVHNVFQYIRGKENQLKALQTIEGLCRPDGFVSLAGDAFGFDRDPAVLAALDRVEAPTHRYGIIPGRRR